MAKVGLWKNVLVDPEAIKPDLDPRGAAADSTREETQKEKRERENAECLGGMRSPWKTVRRSPKLKSAGMRARKVIE